MYSKHEKNMTMMWSVINIGGEKTEFDLGTVKDEHVLNIFL